MIAADRLPFFQLLLSELRMIPVTFMENDLSESALVRAMTANEELAALGWTLSPADVVKLSRCAELDEFPQYVRSMMNSVNAQPMYPGFPQQVMEMSEAKFRFHQMMHYLSTYGMEAVTGEHVLRGWLPEPDVPEKTQEPERLLEARTVQLVAMQDAAAEAFRRILSKNERMTPKEATLIEYCLPQLMPETLTGIKVRFKENLLPMFVLFVQASTLSAETRRACICNICQHTGDVWKCIRAYLKRRHYHFRTAEKRLFVKVLESYPVSDFRTNLMLSNHRREHILLMLRHLDYNTYSRSADHKAAVAMLRSDKLHSWESGAMRRIREHEPDALEYIAQRPGMMLRMLTLLLRNGFTKEEITGGLCKYAGELRTQTIVTLLTQFDVNEDSCNVQEQPDTEDELQNLKEIQRRNAEYPVLTDILKAALESNLAAKNIPVRGKKVAFRWGDFSPEHSLILTNDKSDEGGYIPSGIAYRIPDGVDRIRFFVYWNDECRVDVDLHTYIRMTDGTCEEGGWDANFRSDCMAFSGDITHSDAAEYIDIDLSKQKVDRATATVDVYDIDGPDIYIKNGYFSQIDTCYVGCMAVKELGEEVALYSPANCFFTHDLKSDCSTIQYGYVDAVNRCVVFTGKSVNVEDWYCDAKPTDALFRMKDYLDILCRAAELKIVPEDEAEVVFVVGKPAAENEISLRDYNYFMDTDADVE